EVTSRSNDDNFSEEGRSHLPERRFDSALNTVFPQSSVLSPQSFFIFIIAIALILFEYQFYWPFPTVSAEIPQAVTALAERTDIRAVFDIPWDNLIEAKYAMYLQTAHQHPLI